MKNIHLIPTNKPSRLYLGDNGNFVFGILQNSIQSKNDNFTNQNIYITNNEEIKENDWVICSDYKDSYQELGKVSHIGSPFNFKNTLQINGDKDLHNDRYVLNYCKKIIATTDISLGLPQPSQSFIEKYVEEYNKDNIITEVMVEYEIGKCNCRTGGIFDGCINEFNTCSIEKLKINPKDNTITIRKVKDSWTREEVESLLFTLAEYYAMTSTKSEIDDFNKWIKQNL